MVVSEVIQIMDRLICHHSREARSTEANGKERIANKEPTCFVTANFSVESKGAPAYQAGVLLIVGDQARRNVLESRFWIPSGLPTIRKLARQVNTRLTRPRCVFDMFGGSHPRRPLEAFL